MLHTLVNRVAWRLRKIEFVVFYMETEDIVRAGIESGVFMRTPLYGHSIETISLALMYLMHENADKPEFMDKWVQPRIGWSTLVREHTNDLRKIVNDNTSEFPIAHELLSSRPGNYYIIENDADPNQIIADTLYTLHIALQEGSVSIITGGMDPNPGLWRLSRRFIKGSLREIMEEVFTSVLAFELNYI